MEWNQWFSQFLFKEFFPENDHLNPVTENIPRIYPSYLLPLDYFYFSESLSEKKNADYVFVHLNSISPINERSKIIFWSKNVTNVC